VETGEERRIGGYGLHHAVQLIDRHETGPKTLLHLLALTSKAMGSLLQESLGVTVMLGHLTDIKSTHHRHAEYPELFEQLDFFF
jgi:hypothetical protein